MARIELQQGCDAIYLGASCELKGVLDYVQNAAETIAASANKVLEDNFQSFQTATDNFCGKIASEVCKLAAVVEDVQKFVADGLGGKDVSAILNATGDDSKSNRVQALKEKIAIKLLCSLIQRGVVEHQHNIEGITFSLDAPENWRFFPTQQCSPSIRNQLGAILQGGVLVVKVRFLEKFLEILHKELVQLSECLKSQKYSLEKLECAGLWKDVFNKLIGCTVHCPCCRRLCDANHPANHVLAVGSPGNLHCCQLGHQYLAIHGWSYCGQVNKASLKYCENMKPDDLVRDDGVAIPWKEFIQRYPTWDFGIQHNSKVSSEFLRLRMHLVWQKVGEEICHKYPFFFLGD